MSNQLSAVLTDGLHSSFLEELRALTDAPGETPISTRQASLMTGIAESTFEQWRSTRRVGIPFYKYGRSVRYKIVDIRNFIDRSRVDNAAA